jgi:ureidoacrylate peracid hydrolase
MESHISQGMKNQIIQFDAKPRRVKLDLAKTAVIVVDMQNDFASTGGMFDRAGNDISIIQQAIQPTARVLDTARRFGIKIIYLKMAFQPDLSDLGAPNSPNLVRHMAWGVGKTFRAPDGSDSRILIRDTWSTDIVSELTPQAGDVIVYKNRFNGFYQTDLDDILKQWEVEHLIFTGCTTSVCVESTVRDAMFRDYSCVLLEDCVAEPIGQGLPRSNHDASLFLIQALFGWVSSADQLIEAIQTQRMAATEY